MRRREFIKVIARSAVAWPLAARAQPVTVPVIGFIGTELPEPYADRLRAFRQGLKETGFVEGQNVAVEYRWAQGRYDRLPELAAELVRQQVAVIAATGGEPSPQSAMGATRTIPIVFTAAGDPVRAGLVASLNRPGGNATGITISGDPAVTKRMQLMHELLPQVTSIAYLMDPKNPNGEAEMRAAQTAARSLGIEIQVLRASNEREIDTAFAIMAQHQARALVIGSRHVLLWATRPDLLAVSTQWGSGDVLSARICSGWRSDGLRQQSDRHVSLGRHLCRSNSQRRKACRSAGVQSTKYEFVINLKTAKALGLTIPPGVFSIADEVIE